MTTAAITGTYVLHEHLFPCQEESKRRTFSRMALAVSPGRDPDETRADRVLANFVTVALVLVVIAFVVWLVWVYVL
jgi:hypothetical protein